MRVMTLNVLFGGEDRMEKLAAVVRAASPDILVLQECLDWDDGRRLAQTAAAMSAAHTHLGQARPRGSGKRYHVALLSRRPIERVRDHNDPARLGHCIVDAHIDGIRILGTHFDSHTEDLRIREADYVNGITTFTEPTILTGDLNAISRRDPYPADLADLVKRAGVDKYGHPPRFDTVELLERAGWIDSRPSGEWITARRDRGGVRIDYRTDYVFTTPPMSKRLASAAVFPVHGASDHEALIADFRGA